jgi:hypothetical protein
MDIQRHSLLIVTYWTPSRISEGYYCAVEYEYYLPQRHIESKLLLMRDPTLAQEPDEVLTHQN